MQEYTDSNKIDIVKVEAFYIDETKVGDIFQHFKGELYVILHPLVINATSGHELVGMVVYKCLSSDKIWVREVNEFYGETIHNEKKVRRFNKVNIYNKTN